MSVALPVEAVSSVAVAAPATLVAVADGVVDDDVYAGLWTRLHPVALAGARRLLRTSSLADDAAQETMIRLFRRWPALAGHPNLEGWVVVTCFHVCREMGRRERRLPSLAVDVVAVHDDHALERPELVKALAKLRSRQRDAVLARHVYDLSVAEAAEALGRTEGQIRTACLEGLTNLRKHLDPQELLEP